MTKPRTKTATLPVTPEAVLQLKVTLKGMKPAVWRRVLLPANVTFTQLHYVIQGAMGWENSHLHAFYVEQTSVAGRRRLFEVFDRVRAKVRYIYDFGDSWEHKVVLEKVWPGDAELKLPAVTAGEHACPPEDCGGVWGYVNLLEILDDPDHPEYEDSLTWVGGAWDPEQFELEEANARLPRLRPPRT